MRHRMCKISTKTHHPNPLSMALKFNDSKGIFLFDFQFNDQMTAKNGVSTNLERWEWSSECEGG